MSETAAAYFPGVFDVASPDEAMRIILTAEDSTTQYRWVTETPYLADLITSNVKLNDRSLVLDYGCGIGRIAKALIARGMTCDAALSIWVLQHCEKLVDDIVRVARALAPGGALFVVNQLRRVVPTVGPGWLDDGLDVFAPLRVAFDQNAGGSLARANTAEATAGTAAVNLSDRCSADALREARRRQTSGAQR